VPQAAQLDKLTSQFFNPADYLGRAHTRKRRSIHRSFGTSIPSLSDLYQSLTLTLRTPKATTRTMTERSTATQFQPWKFKVVHLKEFHLTMQT
jgi:hypothetical protein